VAVAITLFGADSPAALATVVGVLVEVPVMLSVCNLCNRSRRWYYQDHDMPYEKESPVHLRS
jgi:arsenite transporter